MATMTKLQTLKKHRGAFMVSACANIASVLFGFDTGVAGGVVALSSFKADFQLSANKAKLANASSNVVAILNLGAFIGALVPALCSQWIGRKMLLTMAGAFFLLGGVIQTAATHPDLGMLYGGRFVAGLGVGMISNTAPVFVAECAPKHLRGLMMSIFELFLVSGGMLAYWTVYGCSIHVAPTSKQWRIPLSLQIVLASLVILGSLLICESPRWLAKKGRYDQVVKSLVFLRSADAESTEIMEEIAEIKAQIAEETALVDGRSLKEFLTKKNLQRLFWGVSIGFWAMWTGHNAILYYGPTVFAQIGFTAQDAALRASGVFTCIKFASTILFMAGVVQFFKRKTLFLVGSFFMGAFLFVLGAILATHPISKSAGSGAPSSQGMMALIYLFVVAYSFSWGPMQWVYIGEIFPTRLRDWGMAASAMMIWLMNYVVSKVAPIMILHIGWKTWMVLGTTNILGMIFVFFLPETKGLGLEEMDVLFGVVDEETRRRDIEMNLHDKVQMAEIQSTDKQGTTTGDTEDIKA